MTYKTKLGQIDVSDEQVIVFENGIPGFQNLRKFTVVNRYSDNPIHWLVSLEDEYVALPVVNPWLVCVDYSLNLSQLDMQELNLENQSDLEIWAILTIPKDSPEKATINLLAPIVINLKNKKAKQVIQEDSNYSVRHFVRDEIERSKKIIQNSKTGSE
ncbi:MAG TPA: flagellar assembly protein FliW [Pseudothermotoga sp.]|nr:flagellar assembly protein FliW [Pseudothermotoga sp.]HOK82723.1 flagellar assembly protein FliW [Pseudothermotoga sp.]HPP70839.1 flagellar assembly protein FliW [Pseudothermotoga sp.]